MELKNSNNRLCETMAAQIIKPIEAFLTSFHRTIETSAGQITPELLVNFLTTADRLNNQCSQQVAWFLIEHSYHPDVRSSSEGTLLRLVRSRCFETLDLVLENYVAYLAQLSIDLRRTIQTLTDSRLRNALTGIEAPSIDKVKRFKLPTAARASAIFKMFEYFKNLQVATELLVDYGCRKIGGAEVDQDASGRALAIVQAALEEPFRNVLDQLENHEIIKRRRWEEQQASENATLSAIVSASSSKLDQRKSMAGSLTLSVLFAVPVWFIWKSGTTNLYVGSATALSAIAALVCFLRTISTIAKH